MAWWRAGPVVGPQKTWRRRQRDNIADGIRKIDRHAHALRRHPVTIRPMAWVARLRMRSPPLRHASSVGLDRRAQAVAGQINQMNAALRQPVTMPTDGRIRSPQPCSSSEIDRRHRSRSAAPSAATVSTGSDGSRMTAWEKSGFGTWKSCSHPPIAKRRWGPTNRSYDFIAQLIHRDVRARLRRCWPAPPPPGLPFLRRRDHGPGVRALLRVTAAPRLGGARSALSACIGEWQKCGRCLKRPPQWQRLLHAAATTFR